jgi:hypothetical protein
MAFPWIVLYIIFVLLLQFSVLKKTIHHYNNTVIVYVHLNPNIVSSDAVMPSLSAYESLFLNIQHFDLYSPLIYCQKLRLTDSVP